MSIYITPRMTVRVPVEAFKCSLALQKYLPQTTVFQNYQANLPHSMTIQKRSFFFLPFGLDIGLVTAVAYNFTKLKQPDQRVVLNIFGPFHGSKESELFPDKVVRCIAHRGAAQDAPENTLEAFKYCIQQGCNFFEFDVRSARDGKLVLLHDEDLERLSGTASNVRVMDWETIKTIDVGTNHPNRQQFKEVHLCLLDDALDYLLENKARMIIDIKGDDQEVIEGILKVFRQRRQLHTHAAITSFNPFVLYQIRKKDPEIVGALSYRPYAFSSLDYDAELGPTNPKTEHLLAYSGLRCIDMLHSSVWRWLAHWCGVSAVLLHKDIVSRTEIQYWRSRDIRCAGWCVNSPVEKLYWSGILKAPYLANTLLGEPVESEKKIMDVEEVPPTRKTILE